MGNSWHPQNWRAQLSQQYWRVVDNALPFDLMKQMRNHKLTRTLAELRQYLTALYGTRLVDVVLFGSQARGDAVVGSDIDVLIVLKDTVSQFEEVARTSEFTSALCLKYDVVISRIFISEEEYLHSQMLFLRNVRREGVHL